METDWERRIGFRKFEFGSFKSGEKRISIIFSNGTVWTPMWKHLTSALKHALITEAFNRRWFGHGHPRRFLVKQVIAILNDRGYNVREQRESETSSSGKRLYQFAIDVKLQNDVTVTQMEYVEERNFSRAKNMALRRVQAILLNSLKKTRFVDGPMEIVSLRCREYQLAKSWDEEWVDKEDAKF